MGDFAYIPIIALLCYMFLLLAFMAAKKNHMINAFLIILAVLILWTGGAFCMRMQLWPGIKFWYDVSILGLTLLPYAFLNFVSEFAELKYAPVKRLWLFLIILVNLLNIYSGSFLKAPDAVINTEGDTVFVYHYTPAVTVLFVLCFAIIINMLYLLLKYSRTNAYAKKQFMPIILGIAILFAGHVMIMIPQFKGFPTDILAGIFNAFFMFYALYRRNLFELRLLVSKGSCYAISAGLSFAVFFNLTGPLEAFIQEEFLIEKKNMVLIIAFIFTLSTSVIYYVMKHFIDMVFIREEVMQAESLKEFSLNISKSLNVNEILKELAEIIQRSIAVKKVYICIADKSNAGYEIVHSTSPLDQKTFKDFPERRENIYSEYASTIYALTAAIDTKDHYTFNHSRNVAYYAAELAYACGMNEDCVEIVREAALLHDIGKIGIPEQILNKPGKLTEEEYRVVKNHVENSISIIRHLPSLDYVIPAVIGHHERYDGLGYPRRIAREDIPISARILCIADSFDAMISVRPYKQPFTVGIALKIIKEEAGLQFDPGLVPIFIELVENGTIKVCEDEPA